jgi:cytochrome c biogenesis protein CcmG, thiol:disulfide interchange protein DsbE
VTSRQLMALGVAAAGIAIGGFTLGARGGRFVVPMVTVGAPAPNFHGVTLDPTPRPRGIVDYRGKVVLLNLWATWCGPCQVEMPSIESLHRRLGPQGLHVVAVSVDDPGNEDRIRSFVASHGLTFEILNEGSGAIESAYQSPGIPSTFLIDGRGVIRMKVLGATDWDAPERRAAIEAVLDEERRAALSSRP